MLWNIIYDFFIQYIFGGYSSSGVAYSPYFGKATLFVGNDVSDITDLATTDVTLSLPFLADGYDKTYSMYLPLGNYLALISTIISMVAIVLICCALIKKIYNMCAHIIG